MTQEDKQLLLKDLCARLPYDVVVRCTDGDADFNCFLTTDSLHEIQNGHEHYDYKPYLRPMSSMTEEEKKELDECYGSEESTISDTEAATKLLDFYNLNHFDYRGLIEKGLALEAPEGMYKTE